MKVDVRPVLVVATLVSGILSLIAVAFWTLESVRVNGRLYARIVQGKDLVADALPPPEYAVEAYGVALQLVIEEDPAERAALSARLAELRKDFDEHCTAWSRVLEPGPLKDATEANHRSGSAFFDVVERELKPAMTRRDADGVSRALARARRLFARHRDDALRLVSLANERNTADEQLGREMVRARTALFLTTAAAVLLASVAVTVLAIRRVTRGMAKVIREASGLAAAVVRGDLEHRGSSDAVPTEFREIVARMNTTMDAFVQTHRELAAANAEVTRSRNGLRKLLESLPDAVVMTRVDGSIGFVNGVGRMMFGIEASTPVTVASMEERVLPEDRPILAGRVGAACAGRDPGMHTIRMLGKQGVRECEINGLLVDFEGAPAIVTVIRDVTERHEAERKLALADRMASLGTLTAGVAHEINNPLSYVLSNLKFVSDELADHEGEAAGAWLPEARQVLGEALEGAHRVRGIVRDLQAFSRPSEKLGPIDVHRVLDLAVNMAESQTRHRANVVKDYGDIQPVLADEARIGQIALNLVINAAQAIPKGGTGDHEIRVVTRMEGPHRVLIEIRDTGCGIAPEHRGRIFEPFFTTKPIGTGTGLGLSICHRIVSSLRGEISVESEVGKGSTFTVRLPAAGQTSTAASRARGR